MGKFTDTAKAVRSYVAAMPQLAGVPVVISYDEEVDLSKIGTTTVVIAPRTIRPNTAARSASIRELEFNVYAAIKVSTLDESHAAADLVEAMLDRIEGGAWRSVAPEGVAFIEASLLLGNESSILELGLFRAEITATYKVARGQL
jgi:hypothetical protein